MIRRKPVVIMGIVSMVFCILHRKTNYVVIPMPAGIGYHINILKINAVFSVAALINMLLMLRTSEKKFIKKLEGTDILKEKNCIIGQCIVFGSISTFISTVWSLKIQMDFVAFIIGKEFVDKMTVALEKCHDEDIMVAFTRLCERVEEFMA